MRAILIDVKAMSVTEVDFDGSLEAMRQYIGGPLEIAVMYPNGDTLYVDEEGMLKSTQHSFDVQAHQPFFSNGLLVGPELGMRVTNVKTSLEEIKSTIRFEFSRHSQPLA